MWDDLACIAELTNVDGQRRGVCAAALHHHTQGNVECMPTSRRKGGDLSCEKKLLWGAVDVADGLQRTLDTLRTEDQRERDPGRSSQLMDRLHIDAYG